MNAPEPTLLSVPAADSAAAEAFRGPRRQTLRGEKARQELLRQLVTAQEEERRRISRELHDEVGQLVTALLLGIRALGDLGVSPPAIEQLRRNAEAIGREVHEIALRLRPTALDDLGLHRTLRNYLEEWSQLTGIPVDFHAPEGATERLLPHIESTVYRIVQEALTNIAKHAGAQQVSVILERRPDQLVVIVEDDGAGFAVGEALDESAPRRLGLLGMQERAALIDAELSIESTAGGGTTVFLRIPLRPSVGRVQLPS